MQTNSSTTARHYGIWSSSLKEQTCEVCGRMIPTHEHFLRFPYFEGRKHTIACVPCALGPDTTAPATLALAEVA